MESVFVDTNVCLDLIAKREPHFPHAAALFMMSETGVIRTCVSTLSFATMDYILQEHYRLDGKKALQRFRLIVDLLPVTADMIDYALSSDFTDLEDAIQHFTAKLSNQKAIITRNIKDFKPYSSLPVFTPEEFIAAF